MTTISDYRSAVAKTLALQASNIALTLVWYDPTTSVTRIRHDLSQLHQRFDRKLLGRRYTRREDRSEFWAVLEKINAHPHVHVGWALPPHGADLLIDMLTAGLWQRICPQGKYYFRDYYSDGWASYAAKAVGRSTENVIFSADFLNPK